MFAGFLFFWKILIIYSLQNIDRTAIMIHNKMVGYILRESGENMKVSAIAQNLVDNCSPRKYSFVKYNNSFTSNPLREEPALVKEILSLFSPLISSLTVKNAKMGIETLEHSTIFPKEKIDGRTVITA